MKKILYMMFALTLIASSTTFAQYNASADAATTKGDWLIDIGVGVLGGDYRGRGAYEGGYGWSYDNANSRVQIPTLSLTVQHAFWNDITIGGQFAINVFAREHDVRRPDGYYQHSLYTQTNMYFLGRGEYHFGRLIGWGPKADLYAGALAGTVVSVSAETQNYEGWGTGQPGTYRNDYPDRKSTTGGPAGGVFGGVRYYFAGNTSVFAEAGVGLTNLRAGFNWRF